MVLSIYIIAYATALGDEYELLQDTVFPPPYVVNLFLENVVLFHLSLLAIVGYLGMFTFGLSVIWLVQTMNMLLGRTTYERFSNIQNKAHKGAPVEIMSEYSDQIHLKNCAFMCTSTRLPSQNELKEYQQKCWIRGSSSSSISTTIFELNSKHYQRIILSQRNSSLDETLDESVIN